MFSTLKASGATTPENMIQMDKNKYKGSNSSSYIIYIIMYWYKSQWNNYHDWLLWIQMPPKYTKDTHRNLMCSNSLHFNQNCSISSHFNHVKYEPLNNWKKISKFNFLKLEPLLVLLKKTFFSLFKYQFLYNCQFVSHVVSFTKVIFLNIQKLDITNKSNNFVIPNIKSANKWKISGSVKKK